MLAERIEETARVLGERIDEFARVLGERIDETGRHMRVLHEEVIGRLAIIQEGQSARRRTAKGRLKSSSDVRWSAGPLVRFAEDHAASALTRACFTRLRGFK